MTSPERDATSTPHEEGEIESIREPFPVSPEVAEAFPVPDWQPTTAVDPELYATLTISVSAKDGYDPGQWDDDTIAAAFAAAEQAVRNLLSRDHFAVDSDA